MLCWWKAPPRSLQVLFQSSDFLLTNTTNALLVQMQTSCLQILRLSEDFDGFRAHPRETMRWCRCQLFANAAPVRVPASCKCRLCQDFVCACVKGSVDVSMSYVSATVEHVSVGTSTSYVFAKDCNLFWICCSGFSLDFTFGGSAVRHDTRSSSEFRSLIHMAYPVRGTCNILKSESLPRMLFTPCFPLVKSVLSVGSGLVSNKIV